MGTARVDGRAAEGGVLPNPGTSEDRPVEVGERSRSVFAPSLTHQGFLADLANNLKLVNMSWLRT